VPPKKGALEMSAAEWRAELARINHDGFISRTRSLEQAATESAYERVRKRSPGWIPIPLELSEPIEAYKPQTRKLNSRWPSVVGNPNHRNKHV
jgi:hypothetical protein